MTEPHFIEFSDSTDFQKVIMQRFLQVSGIITFDFSYCKVMQNAELCFNSNSSMIFNLLFLPIVIFAKEIMKCKKSQNFSSDSIEDTMMPSAAQSLKFNFYVEKLHKNEMKFTKQR